MVFSSVKYLKAAVKLFKYHNPRKLVRKGHFRHRQPHMAHIFYVIGYAEGTSDYYIYDTFAFDRDLFYFFRQFFRGKLFSFDTHGDIIAAFYGKHGQHILSLSRKSVFYIIL